MLKSRMILKEQINHMQRLLGQQIILLKIINKGKESSIYLPPTLFFDKLYFSITK